MLDAHPVPPDALDRLNARAVSGAAGQQRVIFAPWLNGERTPVRRSRRAGRVVQRLAAHHPRRSGPCGLEGIAAETRWMKETVERFASRELDGGFRELTFIGGGANSALWCHTLADILGCTIRQAGQRPGSPTRAAPP